MQRVTFTGFSDIPPGASVEGVRSSLRSHLAAAFNTGAYRLVDVGLVAAGSQFAITVTVDILFDNDLHIPDEGLFEPVEYTRRNLLRILQQLVYGDPAGGGSLPYFPGLTLSVAAATPIDTAPAERSPSDPPQLPPVEVPPDTDPYQTEPVFTTQTAAAPPAATPFGLSPLALAAILIGGIILFAYSDK